MTSVSAKLSDRATVRLSGPDWRALLQGLITNDVEKIKAGHWVYAALLTPQGKYLYDFFITLDGDDAVMDVFAAHRDALLRKLMMYRLRSKVEITPTDEAIHAHWGGRYDSMADPRLPALGARLLSGDDDASFEDYTAHRIALGVPDAPYDAVQEKTLWLESNADCLEGVDFQKGCYVGQELTARMRYRGKVRRRLIPIEADADIPANTPILLGEREIGSTRSVFGSKGIANLKVEDLEKGPLTAGGVAVSAWLPDWLRPTVESAREPA
jgi:hypothetical protein